MITVVFTSVQGQQCERERQKKCVSKEWMKSRRYEWGFSLKEIRTVGFIIDIMSAKNGVTEKERIK